MEKALTEALKKKESRGLGFRLMICHLQRSDIDLSEKNANLYLTLTFQACNASELRLYGDLALTTLGLLIGRIQGDSSASKVFASTHLPKVIDIISRDEIHDNEQCRLAALKTIKLCLKHYPRAIKSGKATLVKFVSRFLDGTHKDLVWEAGACSLLLQNVRGAGGNVKVNDNALWSDYQASLLDNLNLIVRNNFALSKETLASLTAGPFPIQLAKDHLEKVAQNFRRFINLVEFLKIALQQPFAHEKSVATRQILSLISAGLAIAEIQKINARIDQVCFGLYLTEVKIKLLELLETLILVCHTHLRTDFRLVLNILLDPFANKHLLLRAGNQSQFVKVRAVAYRVISTWCSTLQGGSHCEMIAETLVKDILSDILPRPTKSANGSGTEKAKGTGKLSALELLQGREDTELLHREAYKCLQRLLSASGHVIKLPLLRSVHNSLLEICSRIHSDPLKKQNLPVLWSCRLELYKSLAFLLQSRIHTCPLPSEIILTFLSESRLFEKNVKLRQRYNTLFEALEPFIHPQKSDINFKKSYDSKEFLTVSQTDAGIEEEPEEVDLEYSLEDTDPTQVANNQTNSEADAMDLEQVEEVQDSSFHSAEQEQMEDEADQQMEDETDQQMEDETDEISEEIHDHSMPNGRIDETTVPKSPSKALQPESPSENLQISVECTPQDMDAPGDELTSESEIKPRENTRRDLDNLDDDKMIAELEASFVSELK
ncbi:hypothetical protein KR018_009161 [Drosophila ironensis]|nr:hypothetical protein KR018_009161 [Drosophila ironensis]